MGICLLKKQACKAAVLLWAFKRETSKYVDTALLYFLGHGVFLKEIIYTFQKTEHEPSISLTTC